MEIDGVKLRHKYYFIDESGDPNFYDKNGNPLEDSIGYQPYFIMGIVETFDRESLRDIVMQFTNRIKEDVLYNSIPSIAENKDWFVHARRDHPEVRINFIELLRKLDGIKAHVSVVRKEIEVFKKVHSNKSSLFYFDCLKKLLESIRFEKDLVHYIYLAEYGNNQLQFLEDILSPLGEQGIRFKLRVVANKLVPELSIVDYMLWMVQRKMLKGEARFFDALRDKFKVVTVV